MENENWVKKRMMFIKGDDYNFLSYNIFIILNVLGCINGKRSLKDHRKLSFLIDFASDEKLIDLIENNLDNDSDQIIINEFDRELLNQSYTNSLLRLKTINQLVFTLINEDYLLITGKKLEKLQVSLNKENVSNDFLKGKLFSIERNNIKRLKGIIQRISVIDITKMLDQLYYKHGVLNEQLIN